MGISIRLKNKTDVFMKTITLTAPRRLEVTERPAPRPAAPHDVLVRMTAVGVCGSDVHYFLNGKIGSQVVDYPFVLGHEGAGTVEAVGTAVTRVKPGDRIAIEPAMSCHCCDQCRAGRPHTCRSLRFLGCPKQAEGCLSEYMVMPEECCFPVPASMTCEEAALVEPLAIGVYAVRQSVAMPGTRIAVLGCGPIGLSVLLAARAAGADAVFMTDPIAARRAKALEMGARQAVLPECTADMLSAVPGGFDAVFECCGKQEAMDQAVDLLKPGGKLMMVGIPEFDRWSFPVDKLRHREICLQNVRRQNGCAEMAIDLAGQGPAAAMVTHRYPPERAAEAFDLVAAYRDGVVKAVVLF